MFPIAAYDYRSRRSKPGKGVIHMRYSYRGWSLLVLLALLATAPAMAARQHSLTMTGQIQKVDVAANTVTVAGLPGTKEQQMTFHVPSDASITRNAQKVAVLALKQGDRVTVTYAKKKDHLTAHSIAIEPSVAEPAPLKD
jgi:Cu/Ag efflux protein CusF